ncbi:MAG: ATP-binding protein [Oscillospiraceae bacterium]|nr:ATP-binding protein [Oscillospiraceae bacterium]
MNKQILTGAESFQEIIEGDYFYVDKTLFIKELLENRGKVTLITRPRRFGKTMNMSMLESFFDAGANGRALFEGLKIMDYKQIVDKHLNMYPVVFLSLKDLEESAYEDFVVHIRELISDIYRHFRYLFESDRLNEQQKDIFLSLLNGQSTESRLQSSLKFLTECLYTHHQKQAIVLLDEYDAPLTNALVEGYYEKMLKFMRGFLGSVFKTNRYLEFGVLTGVQRIAKEGLLSGFNNPKVCGVMDEEFSACFGFTEDEVKDACEMRDLGDKYDEVKKWYDGYRFGGRDMYNPWSITGYLDRKEFGEYWANTGSMSIFEDVFHKGEASLKNDMAGLVTGAPISMSLEDGITYPVEYKNSSAFWTLLLNAGYIKPCNGKKTDSFGAELVNMEIKNIFSRCAKKWLETQEPSISKAVRAFVGCLLKGDACGVKNTLNDELLNNPSCHDFKEENSYHMFVFGILLAVSGDYTVLSNAESGKGRSDCLIKPLDKEKHAVLIEFKHKSENGKNLKAEAQRALRQIDEKAYVHGLNQEGYRRVYRYGIAFHMKNCDVALETDLS